MSLRRIQTDGYAQVTVPTQFGALPKLEWIAIAHLVIDPEYQRDITREGRSNVRRIASGFEWSKFAPVVVAQMKTDLFAIVDGQHRTTAAALCGIAKVPCAIIECERGEQAAAFRAINGNVTKMHSIQLHHAAVASGDKGAIEIERVAKRADVTILRYPKPWDVIQPGETMALKAIGRAIQKFGANVVVTTLKTIRESGDGNAGMLRAPIVYGSAEVLADHPEWSGRGGALIEAFDTLDLADMLAEASAAAARLRGSSITEQFESRLVAGLEAFFGRRT